MRNSPPPIEKLRNAGGLPIFPALSSALPSTRQVLPPGVLQYTEISISSLPEQVLSVHPSLSVPLSTILHEQVLRFEPPKSESLKLTEKSIPCHEPSGGAVIEVVGASVSTLMLSVHADQVPAGGALPALSTQ